MNKGMQKRVFKAEWETSHHHIDENIICQMLAMAYPQNNVLSIKVIAEGCVNLNVAVQLEGIKAQKILRVYCRDSKAAFIEHHLAKKLKGVVPVPQIYQIDQLDGYTFAIAEYLPGILLRDLLLGNENHNLDQVMCEVGRTLAKIASITFEEAGFFNKMLKVEKRTTQTDFIAFGKQSLREKWVHSLLSTRECKAINEVIENHGHLFPNGEEANLVHGDFDPSNILVDAINGSWQISAILDWEFAFSGSPLTDIANMLRYAHRMPKNYEKAFLLGLQSKGYTLPKQWRPKIALLNLLALLDCLRRSSNQPRRIADICSLIADILSAFNAESKKIEIMPYSAQWPLQYEKEAQRIKKALGDNVHNIHHVGSTSVLGLAAKPKIDIIVEVNNLCFDHQPLLELGYEYRGSFNVPLKHFFRYRSPHLNVNLHLLEENDPEVECNLCFRDYLKNNASARDAYSQLKRRLVAKKKHHQKEGMFVNYTLLKCNFIHDILSKANFKRLRLLRAAHKMEWDYVKKCRKTYFEQSKGEDRYLDSLDCENHHHFILYKGVKMIAYAHVSLDLAKRLIVHIIFTGKEEKDCDQFLALIKKWHALNWRK